MGSDNYYEPDWNVKYLGAADHWCTDCRETTEHEFERKDGITTAWCTTCDFEETIEDPDEF